MTEPRYTQPLVRPQQPIQQPMSSPLPIARQMRPANVWDDIDAEKASMAEEEAAAILLDAEYARLSAELKGRLAAFVEQKFRDEFLQYDRESLAEKTLLALRKAKVQYREEREKRNAKLEALLSNPKVLEILEAENGR